MRSRAISLRSYAQQQTLERLQVLDVASTAALADPSEPAVHDLRVAIRRFRQALKIFAVCWDPLPVKKMHKRLRSLMAAAGEVRNRDIGMDLVGEEHSLPLKTQRIVHGTVLTANLERLAERRTLLKYRTRLERQIPVEGTARDFAHSLLPAMAREFFRHGELAAADHATAPEMHEFRIAGKKFRYSLELFQKFYTPAIRSRLRDVRDVQTLLGDVNDCETVRGLVSDPAVLAQLDERQRKRIEKFRSRWPKLAAQSAKWIHYLEGPKKAAEPAAAVEPEPTAAEVPPVA